MKKTLPATDILRLEQQFCFTLYSTNLAISKRYREWLAPLQLTYPQYLVMLVLWQQDNVTVSQIGEQLFLDSATLTPLLKRMEKAGHLRRHRSGSDERQVFITLTTTGLALKERAGVIPASLSRALSCGEDKIFALKSELEDLRRRLNG